jgi:hypothetical protein
MALLIGQKVKASYSFALRGVMHSVEGEITHVSKDGSQAIIRGLVTISNAMFSYQYWDENDTWNTKFVTQIPE